MKTKIIVLILVMTVLFAYHAVATGYVAGTPSHSTLYADIIRGRAGGTVTVSDNLFVSNINGYEASIVSASSAVWGKSSSAEGYLGGATYGVRGQNGGNYGYLGGPTVGVYGSGTLYGVDATSSTNIGIHTDKRVRADIGFETGAAATCADNTGGAGFLACALNDIAEDIYSKDELESGDVVVIDSENNEHVRLSSKPYDTLAAGIISLNPAFYIRTADTGIPLALAGKVKAKASAENGPIKRGDLLTTSSTPGHLMRCESKEKCFGAMVGKALEPLANGKGKITVLVTLG